MSIENKIIDYIEDFESIEAHTNKLEIDIYKTQVQYNLNN